MAINFPTSLDNFTNPSSGNTLDSPSHSLQHSDINDAVEAMQRKVGVGTAVAGSASAGQVLTISAAGTSTWSTPTPGALVLLNTTIFSAVTSFSLANDTFTSTYDNYKILISITSAASFGYLTGRVRNAGSDLSGSDYGSAMIQAAYASTALGNDNAGATATSFRLSYIDGRQNISMEIMNPKATQFTSFFNTNDRQAYGLQVAGGVYKQTTSVDSFTFISAAGNLAGSYSVYGYSK